MSGPWHCRLSDWPWRSYLGGTAYWQLLEFSMATPGNHGSSGNQVGDYINQVVTWFKTRGQNEWIMFGLGVVIGLLIG